MAANDCRNAWFCARERAEQAISSSLFKHRGCCRWKVSVVFSTHCSLKPGEVSSYHLSVQLPEGCPEPLRGRYVSAFMAHLWFVQRESTPTRMRAVFWWRWHPRRLCMMPYHEPGTWSNGGAHVHTHVKSSVREKKRVYSTAVAEHLFRASGSCLTSSTTQTERLFLYSTAQTSCIGIAR